jgi:hypothetical protein
MDRFERPDRRRVLGLFALLVCFVVAGYLYGFAGFGVTMCLTTGGLLVSMLYRHREHDLSRSRLYREGGNQVMLCGLGLLWIGQTLEGWIATTVGLAAYTLVAIGLGTVAWWWRADWDEEPTSDHDLDQ